MTTVLLLGIFNMKRHKKCHKNTGGVSWHIFMSYNCAIFASKLFNNNIRTYLEHLQVHLCSVCLFSFLIEGSNFYSIESNYFFLKIHCTLIQFYQKKDKYMYPFYVIDPIFMSCCLHRYVFLFCYSLLKQLKKYRICSVFNFLPTGM